ncbi:hypothetical protein SADFL11_PLAS47 [Roseibium alexandrii DFL-11]|uniref:Uncharacterized protein n=1 Tax=Roseibium alexandrii (strain DSM 17067 / NCIMB 14079 / DFL-11) TaxID=244592 RepID=A0A5E8GSL9_ROSAD|nr:hypothetical protein SADFL11_PLAS47 [Roseibium alexandrii DFL-11]
MADNTETLLLLGRIDGKLDSALQEIQDLKATHSTHDKRLGSLERSRATLTGWAAAVGAGASYVVSHFPFPK